MQQFAWFMIRLSNFRFHYALHENKLKFWKLQNT